MDKRFIEESFPVKEVSEESANEKNIRVGNISSLHTWWARKPLASCRTTNYSALIPAIDDINKWNNKREFIINLSKWENISNNSFINIATKDLLDYNDGKPRKVLDPFSGGGAIPLEALRMGCETFASDYNPVAVLIEKCILEYAQKYKEKIKKDLMKWGEIILNNVKDEIKEFYPIKKKQKKGYFSDATIESTTIGYIWARTVRCQNPLCEAEIPLLTQYWLAKKRKITLYPYVQEKEVKFKIIDITKEKLLSGFDPSKGSISRAIVKCFVCNSAISANDVRKQFQQGKSNQKLIALSYLNKNKKGRNYEIADSEDILAYNKAEKYLEKKVEVLKKKWGIEPIPNELLTRVPFSIGCINVWIYGMNNWGDLFNSRQKLALLTFVEKIRDGYKKMIEVGYELDYAKAIISYLSINFSKTVDYTSSLARWKPDAECVVNCISRQGIGMIFNYGENNIICQSAGSWISLFKRMLKVIDNLIKINNYSIVSQNSATELPYQNDYFDAVFTDPPYYDMVPYSYISDFFYVWLKRILFDIYPDLFSTPLTPKSKEIVAYRDRDSNYFEDMLKKSFQEMYRVLKPDGIAIIVYAYKTTVGWEKVINALLDSGLNITASWPINTEMKGRMRAHKSATLASSIYIVARKIKKIDVGFYQDIKKDLQKYLNKKLENLWQEGISGVDFLIAAIGIGIEIFGKFQKIIDYEGNIIRANQILEEIRKIVIDFALKQILHQKLSTKISHLTKFYVLWRWNFQGSKVEFDEAKKLSHSVGINLENEWNKGFIKKSGQYISVKGPKDRNYEDLKSSDELIDILHYLLILWEKGEKDKMLEKIKDKYGESEIIYRVAQAISQSLPNESREKKLIDGFLSGKERIKESIKESKSQDKIDRWTK